MFRSALEKKELKCLGRNGGLVKAQKYILITLQQTACRIDFSL